MSSTIRDTLLKTIEKALQKRGSEPDDYERHRDFPAPCYVVRLCQSLLKALHDAGASTVSLSQLILLESTCTGTDYSQKLALRASALAKGH